MGSCGSSKSQNEESRLEFSKSLAHNGEQTSPQRRFKRRTSAHNGVMQSIAMRFPHIKRSFQACKNVFKKHALEDGADAPPSIGKEQMRAMLLDLGASETEISDDRIPGIFEIANLDHDSRINFKEFLIAAAIGVFLNNDVDHGRHSAAFLEVRRGFLAVQEAFKKIDKDDSGEIDFEELKTAFLAMREDDLINERLKELDFNGDKAIEFPEFVFGLSAWVGMDDTDETTTDAIDVEALHGQAAADQGENVANPAEEVPADFTQPEQQEQPEAEQKVEADPEPDQQE